MVTAEDATSPNLLSSEFLMTEAHFKLNGILNYIHRTLADENPHFLKRKHYSGSSWQ
jgi:hypothetical protein